MRYHAAVRAVIQGIPCVPIPYASKLIALAEEMGVECRNLVVGDSVLVKDQPLQPDAVIDRLEWVWRNRHELSPHWVKMCGEKAQIAREDMRECWKILTT
jgi:polysaccharide pyruvyl transferase WcaK-like protein